MLEYNCNLFKEQLMNKTYEPKDFEQRIYDKWTEKKYFSAKINKAKKPFTIVMPPPNITGQLHIGHALDCTLQDAIIRYKRMQGFEVLWLPGTDHASIATEVKIVEKMKEEGLTKDSLGRDGFLKRAFEWKEKFGGRIVEQQKRLGISCDWDRSAFTMDEKCSKAVKEAFVKMYDEGLIYQGDRIINWCPHCHTAISDAEVEYEAAQSHLWHIRYPLEDGSGEVIIATTRPETLLGDTAVAVHPSDARYQKIVGKNLVLPLVGRLIPIVADAYVEKDFGTGAVKITPAHDPNDFEVGRRHNLPIINIMNDDATIAENGGKYAGMDRYAARDAIVKDLDSQGYLVKIEDHLNNVSHCYRCNTVIEPLVSKQWFVKMNELAKPAIEAVKNKEIRFIPKRFEKSYLRWMENTQDWCISRQLWWGHRIPIFYCDKCGKTFTSKENVTVCPDCGAPVRQDEDVLDTWFSSALWPFSTLGWPDKTEDLEYFYPTDALVTAYDIIGFWVSRMIFSGLHYTGKRPFKDIVIHGIVRDDKGRKMSKSLGNGVDPLEVIDNTGADALRISLVSGISAGGDIKYSGEKLEGYRNFMNKIWNASRFVLMNAEGCEIKEMGSFKLSIADKWILDKLSRCVNKVTKLMDRYEIGLASSELYDFVWSDFCDWYIELSKTSLYSDDLDKRNNTVSVLLYVLRETLKLAHPIIPFITAEIYDALPNKDAEDIMISPYPSIAGIVTSGKIIRTSFASARRQMSNVMEIIKNIRTMRSTMNVSQSKRTALFIKPLSDVSLIKKCAPFIEKLACGNGITIVNDEPQGKNVTVISSIAEVYIPMNELIDKDKELARLSHELEIVESEIARASGKLKNEGFVKKAPPALIEAERAKVVKYEEQRITLLKSIENLK